EDSRYAKAYGIIRLHEGRGIQDCYRRIAHYKIFRQDRARIPDSKSKLPIRTLLSYKLNPIVLKPLTSQSGIVCGSYWGD
ncbi:MAG: hypothetical protein OEW62_08915, partial [Candidatus Bathyarchaeota archaeon]|nr:hypothetical protein [Candidatus Bathyarchaeota archaeon]